MTTRTTGAALIFVVLIIILLLQLVKPMLEIDIDFFQGMVLCWSLLFGKRRR
jgi:hypothetical protein